jgi:hypothetical protein
MTVTGHIPVGMNIRQGVDSGMDMVNHIEYVYESMKRNKDLSVDLQDSMSIQLVNFLKTHHTVIDPTLGVFEMVFRSVKDDITSIEPAFYSLPVSLQALFKNMGMTPERAVRFKPLMLSIEKIVKVLHDAGITLVAGTDMGFPGYSVDREIELYVEAGLTPMEAIQTATIVPARVMNREQEYGSLQTGRKADLVIVEGDPLSDIHNLRKVKTVIKDGEVYDPVALHKLVGFAN